MDEKQSFLRRYGSFPFVLAALLLLFAGIHITVVLSPAFADGIGASVGAAVRAGLAYLTAWIPFSLFETVILCLPLGLAATTIWAVRYFRADDTRRAVRLLCILLAVLLFIYGTFVIAFCPGYYGTTLQPTECRRQLRLRPRIANALRPCYHVRKTHRRLRGGTCRASVFTGAERPCQICGKQRSDVLCAHHRHLLVLYR